MTESKVFTDKLEALRHHRGSTAKFFETKSAGNHLEGPHPLYVVAPTEHQAKLSLVEYLMPLTKWDRRTVDRQYITALEEEAAKKSDVDQP